MKKLGLSRGTRSLLRSPTPKARANSLCTSEVTKHTAMLAIEIELLMDNAGKGELSSLRTSQQGSWSYWI